eukprot:bmy_02797T0
MAGPQAWFRLAWNLPSRPVLRGLWIHLRACEQRGGPGRAGPRPPLGFRAPSVTCHCGPDLSQSLALVTLLVDCAVCHCHGLITVLADQVAPGWLPPELPADTPLTCPVIRAQGNYFASHFFMGGEKFDTPHPEGYLFGENMDLNFLGNRPVQFPYVTPAPHEPVKTLRSLVNIRKDSLRLVRYKDGADSPTEDGEKPRVLYSLEFTFDADSRVAITIYCQAVEEFLNGTAAYTPKSPALQSETVHYKRGVSQQFSLPSFKIDFSEWKDDELNFDLDRGMFPVVIQAVVDEGDVVEVTGHAHVLLAAFEKHVDGSFSVKPLKQKQIVDRVSYLLQEIYGIENKNNQETKPSDEENSDNSNECVVCLSDLRDTLILPCRHLCLCNSCADTLRYQASNCPICRLREWDGRAGGETGTVADVGRDPRGDGVAPSASREVRRRASVQEGLQGSVWGELHRSGRQHRQRLSDLLSLSEIMYWSI